MHVKFTDVTLWKLYLEKVSIISAVITCISIFVSIQDYEVWIQVLLFIAFCIFMVTTFLVMWWKANKKKEAKLKIKNTCVNVKVGDILQFDEKNEFSVIAINEYMDMTDNEYLVSPNSIHGQFVRKMKEEGRLEELVENITDTSEKYKKKKGDAVVNKNRTMGNRIKHPIGSTLNFHSYILVVLARDDDQEKPCISGEEYMSFLMQFWSNIRNAGKTINIAIMGSGITRFEGGNPNKQTLLEIILLTLKLSSFDNSYPDTGVNIMIHEGDAEQIDFYHLEHNSNYR